MIVTALRICIIVVLFPLAVSAQSLNLSVTAETSDNKISTFLLADGNVSVNNGTLKFLNSDQNVEYDVFGVSSDYKTIAVLQWNGQEGNIRLFKGSGEELNSFDTISLADQASFGLYPLDNGDIILRDKIANFTFYDSFGKIVTSMSSSSQSKEGEAISEVTTSRNGQTTVIYNPKIKRNGELGSKAQVQIGTKEFKDIFFSRDRYLKDVIVSDDGSLIVAITAKSGTDDRVVIMDRFGNELNTITAEENLKGAALSHDLEYLTLFSGGRVMVHATLNGKSLGATSLRSPIKVADYFPQDNMIIAITGSFSEQTGVLNGVEFRAVNLKKRSLASKEFPGALGFSVGIDARLVRNGASSYVLKGTNKHVRVQTSF